MILLPLQATYEMATTALEEALNDLNWPPTSPEEVMEVYRERMYDRLYGDRDSLREEDE